MAAETFYFKLGDTEPALEATLWAGTSATPANLAGASGVKLIITRRPGIVGDEYTAQIVSAVNGTVKYEWTGNEFDAAGIYYGEWQVTYTDLSVETFPNDGEFLIKVRSDLN